MKPFTTLIKCALPLVLAAGWRAQAVDETNVIPPVTAREFYNAGTRLLAGKKYDDAEKLFQSAVADQDEQVQPAAVYNLGHARFAEGVELIKKGPDAQKVSARGSAALAAGEQAIHRSESALAENNLDKMIAAYLEGRGARRELRDAEKAVSAAMEIYGKTLQKWQRAADDFKSAAELDSADTNATQNAEIVERDIAKLVDSLRKMQAMLGAMGKQRVDLGKLLGRLKGQIPGPDAPPGAPGEDGEEDDNGKNGKRPDDLVGQKENASLKGKEESPSALSPDQAGQILEGLSIDGSRRLSMSDQEGRPVQSGKGRNW